MNPILTKTYTAGAAIGGRLFVKFGAADYAALQAAANTDLIMGVSEALGGENGGQVDVIQLGIAPIVLGGTVARGEFLTSDENGAGVKLTDAMLAAGACQSGGVALISGDAGDIIPVFVCPQKVSKFDAVTASAAELNILDGVTATAAELNILDGVTATAAELNILDGVTATPAELNILDGQVASATIVVGDELTETGVINVAIQLKDAAGADMAIRSSILAYLSDDANGDSVVAATHSGTVEIGTDGLMLPIVAKNHFQLVSEADGHIDINITESGAKTAYLILVLPNGKLLASAAISHAS